MLGLINGQYVHGEARLLLPGRRPHDWVHNITPNRWGTAVALLLAGVAPGGSRCRIYLEYENMEDGETPVTPPALTRERDQSYYTDLAVHPSRDYLRVEVTAVGLDTTSDDFDRNRVNFHALSAGTAGVHGKPFTHGANSRIFGVAVVFCPQDNDPTQDIVLSALYLAEEKQEIKPASGHVSCEYRLWFV